MVELALRTVLFAALIGLAFAPLERLFAARSPRRTGARADLAFATVGQILTQLGVLFGISVVLASASGWGFGRLWSFVEPRTLRVTANIVTGLLVFELAGYLYHRLAHAVPALWRLHRVHHSAEAMDWLASFRQHPVEILLMTLCQNLPLVLLGIPLGAHAVVLLLLRVHTVFVHSNLKVPDGPWSEVLAMPRFHHRHHARGGPARNYGSLFPWMDRLFGTHCTAEAHVFGVREPAPGTFLGLLVWPLRSPLRRGAGRVL